MRTVTFKISEESYKKLLHLSKIFYLKSSLLIQKLIMAVDIRYVLKNLN